MKLEPSMEHSSVRPECDDFNLREWSLKAKTSRENNTNSRRFSASYIRSFREDAKSFRSNIIISSTASSPGYTLREEIDPSTYSFTTALKALQAKTGYSWEYMSPDGLSLNSKWNEAEKYICNPLSGEVPLECLSAKTLSARSFRQLTSKITMSAPLIYPTQIQTRQFHAKPHLSTHETEIPIPSQEKKDSITRDVGTQSSTPAYLIPNTPSPILTPCIEERSINRCESDADDSSMATPKSKSEEQVEVVKGTIEKEEDTETNEGQRKKVKQQMSNSSNSRCRQGGGCLAWKSLWMRRRQRDKHKSKKKNNLFCHINGC